jgi:hypothetical protein
VSEFPAGLPIRIAVRIDFADGSQHEHEVRTPDAVPGMEGFFPEGVVTADVAARMKQHAEFSALIDGWQRERDKRRELRDSMATEGNRSYNDGYADALDSCAQALKMLRKS